MAAVAALWLVFGFVWLIANYKLAREGQWQAAAVVAAIWFAVLVWLAPGLLHENHDHGAGFSLYFYGHLVYGLCSLAGWNLGRKRRWRRKAKIFFRRCVAALPGKNRLRN
ncbi:hypothetical protein [Leisingera sp. JC1]|uniref:hypothetical protein n=1 Tax=Leisingera sp. JC1 TaxID=1855282 RepID=UPI000807C9F7|nr:hypothetical protein [Leisingera sp. JC1]OBY28285.1 hypothetical protein A9D60_10995 [Leisingera sp. JC1]